MSEPRVLYVLQHQDFSGAETSQAPVIQGDPDALVACPPGSASEGFARGLGARTVAIPFRSLRHTAGPLEAVRSLGRGLRLAADLRRVMRRHPDRQVVYGVGIRSSLIASCAALGLRRRVIWCVADLLPPPPLRGAIRMLARWRADRLVCLSQFIAADVAGSSRGLARSIEVIHPGVDEERSEPAASAGEPTACVVGHVSPLKRTDLAIEIAARVAVEHPSFRLLVVGAAQFRPEDFALERELHERVAADPALSERVEFLGRRADVETILTGCGLLLHCRPDEPYGMVLVEAMAHGLPVVAPRGGGPVEIVEDGMTGLLYEPGDPDDAARKVLSLLSDAGRAAAMGQAARSRARELFSARGQVTKTLATLTRSA
jgi:L-malate glycosyltransferase